MKSNQLLGISMGLIVSGFTLLHSQSISVNEKNGNETNYTMKEIRKITFSDSVLIINKKNGKVPTYPLASIKVIDFQNIYSGINLFDKVNCKLISYPNPVKNALNIFLPTVYSEKVEITISTLVGKVVYAETIINMSANKTHTINTAEFAKGIYICKLQYGNAISTNKIIKQ
jgi:biotin synthase-related radical SAM superfamily protein